MNAAPLPCDFDMEIAAQVNRAHGAYGPATVDAFENYLLADAEFAALLRIAEAEQGERIARQSQVAA